MLSMALRTPVPRATIQHNSNESYYGGGATHCPGCAETLNATKSRSPSGTCTCRSFPRVCGYKLTDAATAVGEYKPRSTPPTAL